LGFNLTGDFIRLFYYIGCSYEIRIIIMEFEEASQESETSVLYKNKGVNYYFEDFSQVLYGKEESLKQKNLFDSNIIKNLSKNDKNNQINL
jgi:hypothetical protein